MALDYVDWVQKIVYVNASFTVPTLRDEITIQEGSDMGMRSLPIVSCSGNDGLYALGITFINGYSLGFSADGTYESTEGNLICPIIPRAGAFLIIRNAVGYAVVDTSNTSDVVAPTWDTAIGITNAYQNNSLINLAWGSASDNSGVHYVVYISDILSVLFTEPSKFGTFDSNAIAIATEADKVTSLTPKTYYLGVRAIDGKENETTNTNYLVVDFTGTDSVLSVEEHDKLMASSSKSDVFNAAMI